MGEIDMELDEWEDNLRKTLELMNYEIEKLRTLQMLMFVFLTGKDFKEALLPLASFIDEVKGITPPIIPEPGFAGLDSLFDEIAQHLRNIAKR